MLPVSDFKFNNQKKQDFNLIGKIKVKVLIFLSIVTPLILCAQLIFASTLATHGQKVAEAEQEIGRLETENTNLKVQIAQESSLARLFEKAKQLGFTPSISNNP